MSRKIKNVAMAISIILLVGTSGFTMYYAKNHIVSENTNISNNNMTPPNMGKAPNDAMNENGGTPPEKPDSDSSDNGSIGEPPEKPSDDNGFIGEPPEKPSGDINSISSEDNNLPTMPNGDGNMNSDMTNNTSIGTIYYVIFGIESLGIALILIYLIMSKFNKKSFKETFNDSEKVVIYVLGTTIIVAALTYGDGYITNNYVLKNNITNKNNISMENNSSVSASGSTVIEDEQTLTDDYEATNSDESAILVKSGGNATIKGSTIKKTGDSTNTENSEFYGINAGVLVTENATATIKNAKISTSAKGSNAVFATGTDSKIYISNSTITTDGESSSRGLDATYGGYIEADNVTITTQGGSCATLATDRGEGTVIAKNSKLETNGSGSPIIYSTGDISIEDTTGTANGSQMVVIEGKNSATITNSELEASGKGNRKDVDQAGIMIYQSMSGDASVGTGNFSSRNSTLTIQSDSDYYKTAPMFFITNTDAIINLENTKLSYGSNILISAKGTFEWGNSGSNGGNLTFNATRQTLTGDIVLDNLSTLDFNLKSSSSYKGTINGDNSAKKIVLTLDQMSKITLTGDSYITELNDADDSYSNINFNGYKLYVDGKAIN